MESIETHRFIKWAGGKQQLIEQFEPLFPKEVNTYFEPFVGSGAVAFYVIQKFKPKKVLLSDTNEELINAFNIVKSDCNKLILNLKEHKHNHMVKGRSYYDEMRSLDLSKLSKLERAARFIYLNKTCFNGLYRVNSKGKFNVPMGSYKNPDIVQEDKLKKISNILKNVEIKAMPFEKVVDLAKNGDFVYFDPPYYPLNKSSFTTYTKNNFLDEEQKRLAEVFDKLTEKGCLCMKSNSDTEFIKGLYKKYNIKTVKARRMINCDATKRGEINEVVIMNY